MPDTQNELATVSAEAESSNQGDITTFISHLLVDRMKSSDNSQALVSLSMRLQAVEPAVAADLVCALRRDIIMSYVPTLTKLVELLNLLAAEHALTVLQTRAIQAHFATLLQQESTNAAMQSVMINFMSGLHNDNVEFSQWIVKLYRKNQQHESIAFSDIYLYAKTEKVIMLIYAFNIDLSWKNFIENADRYHQKKFYPNRIFVLYNAISRVIAPDASSIRRIISPYLSRDQNDYKKESLATIVKIIEDALDKKFITYQDVLGILNAIDLSKAKLVVVHFTKTLMAHLLREEFAIKHDNNSCSSQTRKLFNLMGYIFWLERDKANVVNKMLRDFVIHPKFTNNNLQALVREINEGVRAFDVLTDLPQDIISKIFSRFNNHHHLAYKHTRIAKISMLYVDSFLNKTEALLDDFTDPSLLIMRHLFRGVLALMQIIMGDRPLKPSMVEFVNNYAGHVLFPENIANMSEKISCLPHESEAIIKASMMKLNDLKLKLFLEAYFKSAEKIPMWSFYAGLSRSNNPFISVDPHIDKITRSHNNVVLASYYNFSDVEYKNKSFLLLFFMLNAFCYQNIQDLVTENVEESKPSFARLIRVGGPLIKNQYHLHGFLILFPWHYWPTIVNLLRESIEHLKGQGERFDGFLTVANHEGVPMRVRFLCMHLDRLINPTNEKIMTISDEADYQRVKQTLVDAVYTAKRKEKPLTPGQLCLEMLGGISATMGTALSFFVDNPVAKIRQELIKQIETMKSEKHIFIFLDLIHYYQVKLAQLTVSGSQSSERYNMYLTMELLIVYFNQELPKDLIDIRLVNEKPEPASDLVVSMSESVGASNYPMPSSSSSMGPSVHEDAIPGSSFAITCGLSSDDEPDNNGVVGCSSSGLFGVRESLTGLDIEDEDALWAFEEESRLTNLLPAQKDSDSDSVLKY